MSLKTAAHELDVNFICGVHPEPDYPDYGLKAYYALHQLMSDYDGWQTDGKPSREMEFNGETYALVFDYESSGFDAWENPEFGIQDVKEYRFYFVSKDSPQYDGTTPADQQNRVKGGAIHVSPRWPGITSDGEPVSVPDYGHPYVNFRVQGSNIQHSAYHDLLRRVLSAFDVNSRYVDEPHPDSNIQDLARYVRLQRGESGPLFAPDGPIARAHTLIQGDRSGYRKHEENHEKIPGYMVSAVIEDTKADSLIRGHSLGKELKHYYPRDPEQFDPDEAPYHPKFEVAYQTKRTDDTLRWDELQDAIRELDETVLNCLDWSGITPGPDAAELCRLDPYWSVEETRASRKMVKCPLPDIEDEQEHRVMQIWGDMTDADRDVTELLLTDGGKVSPKDAAEQTGNTYRTVRTVIERLEGLINHTYGEMEIQSKKIQQELLKRVRAAGERFEQEIGSAAMELADASEGRDRSAWNRWRREYDVSVDDSHEFKKILRMGFKPAEIEEAKNILRNGLLKLNEQERRQYEISGSAEIQYADGSKEILRDISLKALDGSILTKNGNW